MKLVGAALLFGLALLVPAFGQNLQTVSELHAGCQSSDVAIRAYAIGFISGVAFTANYMSKGTLEKQALWPKTKGGIVDAVCKYIDLHPEIWAEEATLGVLGVVNDLYLPGTAKGTKK